MFSGKQLNVEQRNEVKFCVKSSESFGMLKTSFRKDCMTQNTMYRRNKYFKKGWENVEDLTREKDNHVILGTKTKFLKL